MGRHRQEAGVDTPGTSPTASRIVGAGDLIGASVFASAVANDQPTIDVMNEIGLDASAVGNHEFDKGWADLRDRVIADKTNAKWDYLGANVYQKGTTTPRSCRSTTTVHRRRRCQASASSVR